MDKQVNVLYFSATDTTAQVVKAVAEGIGGKIKEYNITLPQNRKGEITFGEDDLLIVGVPVYMGRVPAFLTDFFSWVRGMNTAAVFIVVYGNRDYEDALLELKDTFEENGFIGIAGGAFIGEHSNTRQLATGRPDVNDLHIAHDFGLEIKEKLLLAEEEFKASKLYVRGNSPYKEIKEMPPMIPETSDQCTQCGLCANQCPKGAIRLDDCKEIDSTRCIHCSSCVKKCPVGAKFINHELFVKITQGLLDNFGTVRHEPDLFII